MAKQFVTELSSLLQSYGASDARESISLSAAMTMPSFLLQKHHPKSTSKEHVQVLARRLDEWKKDNVSSLLHEGRCIQQRLKPRKGKTNFKDDDLVKFFAKFMRQGKVRAAIRLLLKHEAGILNLNEKSDAQNELTGKHSNKAPIMKEAIITDHFVKEFHPVIFESITGEAINTCALKTNGSAGL